MQEESTEPCAGPRRGQGRPENCNPMNDAFFKYMLGKEVNPSVSRWTFSIDSSRRSLDAR